MKKEKKNIKTNYNDNQNNTDNINLYYEQKYKMNILEYADSEKNEKNDKNEKNIKNTKNYLSENNLIKLNNYIGKVSVFDEYVFFNLRYSKFLELSDKLSNGTFVLIERENQLLLAQILSQKDLSIYEDENKIKAIITHNEDITPTERDIYTSREYKLKILGTIFNKQFNKELNFYPTRLDNVLFFDEFDIILNYFNKKNLKKDLDNFLKIKLGKIKNGSTKTNYDLQVYLSGFILLINIDNKFIIDFFSVLNKKFLVFTTDRYFALELCSSSNAKLIDLNSLNLNTLTKNEEFNFITNKLSNLVFLYDSIFSFDSVNIIKLLLEQFVKIDSDFILYLDDDINYFDDKFLSKNIFFRQFINRLNNKLFIYKTSSLDKFSVNLLTKVNYIISKDISLSDTQKIYNNFSLVNFYASKGYEITNGELVLSFEID